MDDSEDVFVCGDRHGNGCGRMFDSTIVEQINHLCKFCHEDLA